MNKKYAERIEKRNKEMCEIFSRIRKEYPMLTKSNVAEMLSRHYSITRIATMHALRDFGVWA